MKKLIVLFCICLLSFGSVVPAAENSSEQISLNESPSADLAAYDYACPYNPCPCEPCAPVCATDPGISWVGVGIGAAAIAGIVIALTADRGSGDNNNNAHDGLTSVHNHAHSQ